jgi:atypical dual specificity phosphatase
LNAQKGNFLWWLIPGVLAGMPMPFIHPERRLVGGGAMNAFDDELPVLNEAGVRSVVSLLNIPTDTQVYCSVGFTFLCLPLADGQAPTFEQAEQFVRFVSEQRTALRPVAGLGRTGTMLAVYLISQGETAAAAIRLVRSVESAAVETLRQIHFLEQYAEKMRAARA